MKKREKLEKFISKNNLKRALSQLLKDTLLVAPQKAYGDIVFQEVESIADIVFDYENCINAPKDYLLLNDEVLFRYNLNPALSDPERFSVSRKGGAKVVIFGSRACDTKAIGLLDKFFSRNLEDPLYFAKRKNTLIITLSCQKLGQNCFCTATGSGPYLEDGFDIQLIDTGDGYILQASSLRGKDFVKTFSHLMAAVDSNKKRKKEDTIKKAVSSKGADFNLKKVYDNLSKSKTKSHLWKDLSQRCQNCGGCLLICPTCSCFYVVDKKIDGRTGQWVRCLDSCYYEGFTRMAGGYNPCSPKPLMMQRKFYHKLKQQLDEFSEPGCTGCGRCNEICPGNINWLESLKKIAKS